MENSRIDSPVMPLDVNWPGDLNAVGSETVTELKDSQQKLQEKYDGQIDPSLLAISTTLAPAPSTHISLPTNVAESSSQALAHIQNEAHLNRLQLQQQMDDGKGTNEAYPRQVKNYEKFWEDDQNRRAKLDPNHIATPAHPIIGEKVAIFLQHEMTRNKACI